jgi:hypothetical protein
MPIAIDIGEFRARGPSNPIQWAFPRRRLVGVNSNCAATKNIEFRPEGSGPLQQSGPSLLPTQIDLPMLGYAISEIEVDQTLVRNAGFLCHLLEVIDDILAKANRY